MSRALVEERAEEIRKLLGVEACIRLDAQTLLSNLRKAIPGTNYVLVDDGQLPSDVLAQWDSDTAKITIKRSVYRGANYPNEDPRMRFTIVHEIIHAVESHQGTLNRNESRSSIPMYSRRVRTIENFTDALAAAVLAPKRLIRPSDNSDDIAIKFGLSQQAARIRMEEIRRENGVERRRPKFISDLLEELKGTAENNKPRTYADKECGHCHQKLLIAIGAGYICDNCDTPQK